MRELVQARLNPLDSGPVLDDNDANWRLRSSPVSGIGPLSGVGQQEAEMRIRLLKSIGASTVAVFGVRIFEPDGDDSPESGSHRFRERSGGPGAENALGRTRPARSVAVTTPAKGDHHA